MDGNQKEWVLWRLKVGGSLTSLEAWEKRGISRLAAIIFRLRGDGVRVRTKMVTVANRIGEPAEVAAYYLDPADIPAGD
jgi:hypothetical protein